MRVFVTGATGFIGRHLCERFVARGDHVIALVRNPEKATRLSAAVEAFPGDLSVFADPKTVLPECDVVVHLAGVIAAQREAEYEAINLGAVKDLLSCLERQSFAPKRLVFASSLAAAGPSVPGRPWTEADPLAPIEPYGAAKAAAEAVVQQAPFPTTILRPPIVLGPHDEASLTLFRSARSGVGMVVAGGPQELSFVDVRDLADAFVLAADDRRAGSFVYYASHPARIDVLELWRELEHAVGRPVRVFTVPRFGVYLAMLGSTLASKVFGFKNQLDDKQYRQMAAPAFACSSARLIDELGFAPAHDLRDCLAHAADGYRAAGVLKPVATESRAVPPS